MLSTVPVRTADVSSDRVRRRARTIDLVVVSLMPLVLLPLLRVSPYFRLNNGDPFIYIGYSEAFVSHVERFGYTYHSVRFGLIFPLRASLVLGPVWGYFILRYLLYLVAIVPMWRMLRPLGRHVALLGPALFVTCPVVAEAILTTHHDTIVVPMFSAMCSLLVIACRTTDRRAAALGGLAGLAAGLAVNANIFIAPVIMLVAGIIAVLVTGRRGPRHMALTAGPFVAGVAAVSLFGMLVYWRLFGDANIYATTFRAAREISDDTTQWRTPGLIWLSTRRYAFAPPIALALGALGLLRIRRAGFVIGHERWLVFGIPAVVTSFYVLHQFALGGTSIEQAYYYSFGIGPVLALVAASVSWLGAVDGVPRWTSIGVIYLVAVVGQAIELRRFVVFAGIAIVLLVGMVVTRRHVTVVLAVILMHLCWGASPRVVASIPGAGFQYEPAYEKVFGDADPAAFEAYLLAGDLTDVVPSRRGAPVPLFFWYRTGDQMIDAVEASYHWQTLTVQRGQVAGMPEISDDDMERLRMLVGGYVILLARTDEELDAGRSALASRGVEVGAGARRTELRRGTSVVKVDIAPIVAVPPPG